MKEVNLGKELLLFMAWRAAIHSFIPLSDRSIELRHPDSTGPLFEVGSIRSGQQGIHIDPRGICKNLLRSSPSLRSRQDTS